MRRLPADLVLLGTLFVLLAVTALDGRALAAQTAWGQPLAVALTLGWWALCFRQASPRLRLLMIAGVFAATAGEVLFSLVLGMYTYRLERIPLYVPPGHTLLYAAVFLFVRRPWVRRHQKALTLLFLAISSVYSVVWLLLRDDLYGFCCFLGLMALLLAVRGARLFFATMYLLVAYLELSGTHFGAWVWPARLLGRIEAMPSGNPPSGVALFYVLFDLSCLALYLFVRWASFERWVSRRVSAAGRARRSEPGVPPAA